jgi:hypothetical protein
MQYQCVRKIEKGEKHDYRADLSVLKKEIDVNVTNWRLSSRYVTYIYICIYNISIYIYSYMYKCIQNY